MRLLESQIAIIDRIEFVSFIEGCDLSFVARRRWTDSVTPLRDTYGQGLKAQGVRPLARLVACS
jgi:hypothetical protein